MINFYRLVTVEQGYIDVKAEQKFQKFQNHLMIEQSKYSEYKMQTIGNHCSLNHN